MLINQIYIILILILYMEVGSHNKKDAKEASKVKANQRIMFKYFRKKP